MEKETLSMQDSFMVGFPALFYPLSFSFSASYNFPRQIEEKLAKMQTGYGTDNRFRVSEISRMSHFHGGKKGAYLWTTDLP